MTDLELLAPARNADIGIAAIDCGADAVYIAGPGFGARQDAGNPMEDVRRLCEYAHRFGARIFLTLNTILYDSELPAAERLLEEARESGVDAIIAQDLSVFEILRSKYGDTFPVHASTQCAIRTPEQARFYQALGASRLVLERQLSLEQIRAIQEAVDCELEFFVHGALCVCYSGQCYMSEAVTGRSANRGACAQACRSLYDLRDRTGKTLLRNKASLSLKDYNLIGRLPDLAEEGICSFKIEGRLKNISYVRNVVRAYSLALDELVAGNPGKYRRASFGRVKGGFTPDLGKTFNRGYTELFLDGIRGKWSSMDAPKSVGEEIGTVISITSGRPSGHGRVHPRFAAAEYGLSPEADPGGHHLTSQYSEILIRLDNPATALRNGDGFSFMNKDGTEILGFRGDVCRGARIVCREVPGLYVGARLRRNLSVGFEKEMEANLPERRIPVEVAVRIFSSAGSAAGLRPYSAAAKRGWTRPGSDSVPAYTYKLRITATSEDGRKVDFETEAGNQTAANAPRMEAMFRSQIGKTTGTYSFSMASLEIQTLDGSLPFLSAAALNGIRREVAERLDKMPCGRIPMGGPVRQETASDPSGRIEGYDGAVTASYKANISNHIAREVLQRLGAENVEDAFEITHKKEAELMRSKYCVRHELGLCLKDSSAKGRGMTDLYLVNNGRRYRLGFDCSRCEMIVNFN